MLSFIRFRWIVDRYKLACAAEFEINGVPGIAIGNQIYELLDRSPGRGKKKGATHKFLVCQLNSAEEKERKSIFKSLIAAFK